MSDLHFEDNSMEVKAALEAACLAWLEEAAGELESATKRNTPVDTGQLKGSWNHKVDESTQTATIGSPLENAIWNEFGTGQYAVNNDGRKTPWRYKDLNGKWHTTTGKKPQRSLQKAFDSLKNKLQTALETKLKGLS